MDNQDQINDLNLKLKAMTEERDLYILHYTNACTNWDKEVDKLKRELMKSNIDHDRQTKDNNQFLECQLLLEKLLTEIHGYIVVSPGPTTTETAIQKLKVLKSKYKEMELELENISVHFNILMDKELQEFIGVTDSRDPHIRVMRSLIHLDDLRKYKADNNLLKNELNETKALLDTEKEINASLTNSSHNLVGYANEDLPFDAVMSGSDITVRDIIKELRSTIESYSSDMDFLEKKYKNLEETLSIAISERDFSNELLKSTKSLAESCKEERALGNDGCEACSELRSELEFVKTEQTSFWQEQFNELFHKYTELVKHLKTSEEYHKFKYWGNTDKQTTYEENPSDNIMIEYDPKDYQSRFEKLEKRLLQFIGRNKWPEYTGSFCEMVIQLLYDKIEKQEEMALREGYRLGRAGGYMENGNRLLETYKFNKEKNK